MNEDSTPYAAFIEVVLFPYPATRWRILTGEMIAAYAEVQQLFGRTKGTLDPHTWAHLGDDFQRYHEMYTSAWSEFTRRLDEEGMDSAREFGPKVFQAFTTAATGFRQVRDALRLAVAPTPEDDGR